MSGSRHTAAATVKDYEKAKGNWMDWMDVKLSCDFCVCTAVQKLLDQNVFCHL